MKERIQYMIFRLVTDLIWHGDKERFGSCLALAAVYSLRMGYTPTTGDVILASMVLRGEIPEDVTRIQ